MESGAELTSALSPGVRRRLLPAPDTDLVIPELPPRDEDLASRHNGHRKECQYIAGEQRTLDRPPAGDFCGQTAVNGIMADEDRPCVRCFCIRKMVHPARPGSRDPIHGPSAKRRRFGYLRQK